MSERPGQGHLRRLAVVYVRQSTASQLERNRESTDRQYALAERAVTLGWARESVMVIDEDLGLSGSGTVERAGFARLTAEVALGNVGIVVGLEVSLLARNNADWYRLLDLCAMTDTLIADEDGIYHPASFNDRLVLGLKGTMSEAELHVLRARLEGGMLQQGRPRRVAPRPPRRAGMGHPRTSRFDPTPPLRSPQPDTPGSRAADPARLASESSSRDPNRPRRASRS